MTVKVNSTLEPRTGGYSLVDDSDLAGGLHIVADAAARDLIPDYNRKIGMLVYTQAEDSYWKLTQIDPILEWAELSTPLTVYSNATRPDADAVAVGTVIYNTNDNAPNISDGTNWRDMTGIIT